jgi:alanyl-tRNA synthetase
MITKILPGSECFRLVDTFGLPFDMLQELMHERNLGFEWLEFCYAAAVAGWSMRRLKALADEHFNNETPDEVTAAITFAYHCLREPDVWEQYMLRKKSHLQA